MISCFFKIKGKQEETKGQAPRTINNPKIIFLQRVPNRYGAFSEDILYQRPSKKSHFINRIPVMSKA